MLCGTAALLVAFPQVPAQSRHGTSGAVGAWLAHLRRGSVQLLSRLDRREQQVVVIGEVLCGGACGCVNCVGDNALDIWHASLSAKGLA
eukprot:364860-Chlamydomonas_euryale.AAC.6